MVGLQRLGTLLLEEHDFDRVLQSICLQLQRLTDAGGVGIALLEEDPRYLEMRTVVGPSADALRGARIPTEGSFASEALRTNRPQRSDDAQNDPRGYKKSLTLGNTRTILSVPMKTRQRCEGVSSSAPTELSAYYPASGSSCTRADRSARHHSAADDWCGALPRQRTPRLESGHRARHPRTVQQPFASPGSVGPPPGGQYPHRLHRSNAGAGDRSTGVRGRSRAPPAVTSPAVAARPFPPVEIGARHTAGDV